MMGCQIPWYSVGASGFIIVQVHMPRAAIAPDQGRGCVTGRIIDPFSVQHIGQPDVCHAHDAQLHETPPAHALAILPGPASVDSQHHRIPTDSFNLQTLNVAPSRSIDLAMPGRSSATVWRAVVSCAKLVPRPALQ